MPLLKLSGDADALSGAITGTDNRGKTVLIKVASPAECPAVVPYQDCLNAPNTLQGPRRDRDHVQSAHGGARLFIGIHHHASALARALVLRQRVARGQKGVELDRKSGFLERLRVVYRSRQLTLTSGCEGKLARWRLRVGASQLFRLVHFHSAFRVTPKTEAC